VQRVKEIWEDKAKFAWIEANSTLHREISALEALASEKEEVESFGYKQTDLEIRVNMYRYLAVLAKRIENQQAKVYAARLRADQAKESWILARQEREVLDKLRERKFEEHRKLEAAKDQKVLDDMKPQLPSI